MRAIIITNAVESDGVYLCSDCCVEQIIYVKDEVRKQCSKK